MVPVRSRELQLGAALLTESLASYSAYQVVEETYGAEHLRRLNRLLTSLDLYRELQAVTPDSLQYLLHDLFAANNWELETDRATAEETEAGAWQVTVDVRAGKVVVDTEGIETEAPMDDWLEIGVFGPADEGERLGAPLYLEKHRVRSGEQTITVTVQQKPTRAGIDPYFLLIDSDTADNAKDVTIGS